ncbi:hypothetical protein PIB30_021508 [Stylosanthes scabra]|uniref:Uncharacterized protein n=1 Tax=Stylosanthes scabra TaxID=79078 RepID=A0ABU6Q8R0_9FABA|nr:hypothetical protein [Stylosanthes scabra]
MALHLKMYYDGHIVSHTSDGYYSDSEEEFEGNYEIDYANEEDVPEHDMESDVEDVANALANELHFQEPSFMPTLDEKALKAPEFAEDMNPEKGRNGVRHKGPKQSKSASVLEKASETFYILSRSSNFLNFEDPKTWSKNGAIGAVEDRRREKDQLVGKSLFPSKKE